MSSMVKLTLRMDEDVIRDAKRYAKENGRSLSALVADFFVALAKRAGEPEAGGGPSRLTIPPTPLNVEEADVAAYLERKHG